MTPEERDEYWRLAVTQAIERANLADAAEQAKQKEKQAQDITEAIERSQIQRAQMGTLLDAGWELTAYPGGVFLELPDCLPIQVQKQGPNYYYEPSRFSDRDNQLHRVSMASERDYSHLGGWNLDAVIRAAAREYQRDQEAKQRAIDAESAAYEGAELDRELPPIPPDAPLPEFPKSTDERIADALEKIVDRLGTIAEGA